MTEQPEHTDPDLQQALESARQKPPSGDGPAKGTLILGGLVLVVAGFLGGYVLNGGDDSAQATNNRPNGMLAYGGPGGGQGQNGQTTPGNVTFGTVTDINGSTITIKTTDGKSVKVEVSSDTSIQVTEDGSISDLAKGDSLVVNGTTDDDTVKADTITEGGVRGGPAQGN